MIVIPVITLVLAVCIAVVAGLAWSAKLPGNNWIGIRAPEARKSQENWDITHRVAGPPWAVSAVAFLGATMLGFLAIRPEASGWMWLWYAVALLAGIAMLGIGAAIGSVVGAVTVTAAVAVTPPPLMPPTLRLMMPVAPTTRQQTAVSPVAAAPVAWKDCARTRAHPRMPLSSLWTRMRCARQLSRRSKKLLQRKASAK